MSGSQKMLLLWVFSLSCFVTVGKWLLPPLKKKKKKKSIVSPAHLYRQIALGRVYIARCACMVSNKTLAETGTSKVVWASVLDVTGTAHTKPVCLWMVISLLSSSLCCLGGRWIKSSFMEEIMKDFYPEKRELAMRGKKSVTVAWIKRLKHSKRSEV